MSTSIIDIRIDDAVKAAAEKASALQDMKSLTEYVERLIEKDAQRVIREHASIVVNDDILDRFMGACAAAEAPNERLRKAAAYADERGIR